MHDVDESKRDSGRGRGCFPAGMPPQADRVCLRRPGLLIFFLLFFLTASAVFASSRRDDMRHDGELVRKMLDRHGSFDAWSRSLHADREKFNRGREASGRVYSHAQFGNFVEAMKSISAACGERGLDFIVVRVPSPAERAFSSEHGGAAPDPYIHLMRRMLEEADIELVEPLLPGTKPLAERLRERYPRECFAKKALFLGRAEDFPGPDAERRDFSGGGAYLAGDLVLLGGHELLNRPAVVFAAPAELLYRDSAVLPSGELLRIPEAAYRPAGAWDAANWTRLGFEPLPDRDDPFFRITDDGALQIAPLLPGADDGAAGTLRLPLPDPPGSAVRAVLKLERPAELEVRARCGRDDVMAGVTTDREGSRVELRLRPTWLSRILTLQFRVRGKAQLREIRLYSAP